MTTSVDARLSGSTTSWLTAGLTLVVIGWGANQFSPLLVAYESSVGAMQANALFALYAVGLVPGLFIGGPLSDRRGRRPIAMVALLFSLVASAVLAAGAFHPSWLYVGRLFAGLASGIGFSCGAAWVQELSVGDDFVRGPRRAATAMTFGFAGGPLVAGLLAQFAAASLVVAYIPHLVITIAAIVVVARAPNDPRPPVAIPTPATQVRRADHRLTRVLILLAPWVFITASVGLAVLPGMARSSVGDYQVLFAAVAVALGALCGILIQPVIARIGSRNRLVRAVAYGLGIGGLGFAALAAAGGSVILVVIGCSVSGAAYGALLVVGLGAVRSIAPPDRLGRTVASFQAATYVGYTSPFFISLAARCLPLETIMLVLSVAAAGCLGLIELLESVGRSQDRRDSAPG